MSKFMPFSLSSRTIIATALAALIALTSVNTVANADTAGQQSTRDILIGGLVAAAAVILYNNYYHRQAVANSIVGYTRGGGVVHGDGRVTYPDGTVLYTGGAGQRCSYDGYGAPCNRYAYAPGYGYAPGSTYAPGNAYAPGYPYARNYNPAYYQGYNMRPGYQRYHRHGHRWRRHKDRDDRQDRDDEGGDRGD